MKFIDILSLSTRMFKNKPLRTFLTVLGVGVGIGTVLFLVSFGYGLQRTILNRITTADSLLSLDVSSAVSDVVVLDQNNVENVKKVVGVAEVARLASIPSQIDMKDQSIDSVVYAIDPAFFRLNGLIPQVGNVISGNNSREAVISSATSKLFNLEPQTAIGKEITLNFSVPSQVEVEVLGQGQVATTTVVKEDRSGIYRIVGVIDDENSSYAYVPLDSVSVSIIPKYDQLKVKVVSGEQMESVRDQLLVQGLLVSSLSDTLDEANKIFRIVQIVLFMFGFIALFVSAIGMFNTMTIALLEKTNEIGIMRSIGITAKDIKSIFLMEAGLMGILGGIGGVIMGVVTSRLVNFALNLLASNFGGRPVDVFYSPTIFILLIIVFSGVVGFLTGVYPSIRAAKINPLEALRYK